MWILGLIYGVACELLSYNELRIISMFSSTGTFENKLTTSSAARMVGSWSLKEDLEECMGLFVAIIGR